MADSFNGTSSTKPLPDTENTAAALFVIFTSLVSTAGNGIVILSYFMCHKLRSHPGNCFVINLALADLLSGVYVQLPCMFNLAKPRWHFSGNSCIVHSVFTWTVVTVSNWSLAAISIERAIAVNRPFRHPNWVTKFRVGWVIGCFWICSLIIASCSITPKNVAYTSWELMCSPRWTRDNIVASYNAAILCFFMPSILLLISNMSIIYAVRRLKTVITHRSPDETGQGNLKFSVKDHTRTLRSLYVLVVVYFLCVAPYFFAKFSFIKHHGGLLPRSLVVLSILLMFAASALNPFIYALFRKDHKEAYLVTIQVIIDKIKSIPSFILRRRGE